MKLTRLEIALSAWEISQYKLIYGYSCVLANSWSNTFIEQHKNSLWSSVNDDEGFTLVVRTVCKFIRWMIDWISQDFRIAFYVNGECESKVRSFDCVIFPPDFRKLQYVNKKIRVITPKSVGDITPMWRCVGARIPAGFLKRLLRYRIGECYRW